MNLEIHDVRIEYPEECNIIIGQTHFIKTGRSAGRSCAGSATNCDAMKGKGILT
jgi:adenosine/AMP kinase